jgi:hypothetical protein
MITNKKHLKNNIDLNFYLQFLQKILINIKKKVYNNS